MKDLKTILESKPKVEDYDCQPYGYINALQNYINKLEGAINYSRCCKSDSELLICDTCKSGLIDYPEIYRRTCRCGALGYNVTD